MTATLANTNVQTITTGTVDTTMSVMSVPGFEEQPSRPMVYIGGEEEGGRPFYTWDHENDCRNYVPVNRFAGRLLELKIVVKNPDDKIKRSEKLIAEFETASGQRVALCCGANTYAAMGLIAGLAKASCADLQEEIGISGKVGSSGKVTFVNVYLQGEWTYNKQEAALLKEAKNDGMVIEAIKGYMATINQVLLAANAA